MNESQKDKDGERRKTYSNYKEKCQEWPYKNPLIKKHGSAKAAIDLLRYLEWEKILAIYVDLTLDVNPYFAARDAISMYVTVVLRIKILV